MSVKILSLLGAIAKTQGVKFASFTYKAKGTGEVSKILVSLGFSTENVYRRDLQTVMDMIPNLTGIELEAAEKIRDSLIESLAKGIGNNSAYVHGADKADTYAYVENIPGIMVHKETGEVYVKGLVQRKEVLTPGTYKTVNSRPLTLAKAKIEKGLGKTKIRQYDLSNVIGARLNGDVLEFE